MILLQLLGGSVLTGIKFPKYHNVHVTVSFVILILKRFLYSRSQNKCTYIKSFESFLPTNSTVRTYNIYTNIYFKTSTVGLTEDDKIGLF